MGLLDDLYFGHRANFGGQNGGLLDFLRNTQMQQDQYQPSGGFAPMAPPPQPETAAQPIQVGGLQMPRIGEAAKFDPAQVNIPPNAQPTSGQIPVPAPQQQGGGGFLESLNENFQNMGNGGSLIGALTGHRPNNQTAQFLVSKGIDPALAKSIVSDPATLRSVLPSLIGAGGQTDDIKEYQFAKREEPNLTFQQFMQRKRAVSGEYSLTPQYGTDAQGNTVLIQTGKSGEAIQTILPPGVKISSGIEKIDLGTSWGLIDKRTGNLVGTQAKDVAGKERETAIGKGQGEAATELASIQSKMPGLETVVKKLDGLAEKATYTIGGKIVDFSNRQAGLEPREAAIARTEYISMVDNQILPLLRDTFGAAFTQKEGDTLRATLGDPDKSPKEKQVILRSFIEQKRRDVEALEARTGRTSGGQTAQAADSGGWQTVAPNVRIREKR